jgi:hypothetical protein
MQNNFCPVQHNNISNMGMKLNSTFSSPLIEKFSCDYTCPGRVVSPSTPGQPAICLSTDSSAEVGDGCLNVSTINGNDYLVCRNAQGQSCGCSGNVYGYKHNGVLWKYKLTGCDKPFKASTNGGSLQIS